MGRFLSTYFTGRMPDPDISPYLPKEYHTVMQPGSRNLVLFYINMLNFQKINLMDDTAYQKRILDRIFLTASSPPIFKSNDKYCKGKFSRAIPFISYDDIMNWEYVIRAGDSVEDDIENYIAMDCPVIMQYNSIKDLVHDGWRLD